VSDTVQVRVEPLERELWERIARRRGSNLSELIRRAVRKELSIPAGKRLDSSLPVARISDLYDHSARLGITSDQLLEIVLRDHLDAVSPDDLDETARRTRARNRAKELLGQTER